MNTIGERRAPARTGRQSRRTAAPAVRSGHILVLPLVKVTLRVIAYASRAPYRSVLPPGQAAPAGG